MNFGNILRRTACTLAAALTLAAPHAAFGQSRTLYVSGTAPAGANPTAIAIDPATRKIYVANHDDNTVTVLQAGYPSATVIATIPVGRQPNHIAVNTETDAVYVSNEGDGTMSVIDARTDQVRATSVVQVGGAMAVDPNTNHMFMLRESPSDEFNIIVGDAFLQASATRSYQPVTLAMNPVTNRLFVGHEATSDVVPFDMNGDAVYPTRECPNGSGGLIPDPGQSNPNPPACIDVPGYPVSIAVNPVTNRAYALTSTGQVAVIQGPNMTWSTITLPPAMAGAGPVAIAVNPLSNVIYALFQNKMVQINGDNNSAFASQDIVGPAVGLVVDPYRKLVLVPTSTGQLYWMAGDLTGIYSGSIAIASDARGIVFDATAGNRAYVVSASGVSTVVASDFPSFLSPPIQASVQTLPNNHSGTSGTFTFSASSSMSPAPLDQVRAVFYRIIGAANNNGAAPFLKATRNPDGTWSGPYAGLTENANYSLEFFATNGLEMDSINTDKVHVPVAGAVQTYSFYAQSNLQNVDAIFAKSWKRRDFNGDGRGDLAWRHSGGAHGAWLMNGLDAAAAGALAGPAGATIAAFGDFDGDGKTDAMWRGGDNSYTVTLLDGATVRASATLLAGGSSWSIVSTGDFNGDGKADILWRDGSGGYGVWYMNGAAIASAAGFRPATASAPVGVADFDGDGRDEIIWMSADGGIVMTRLPAGALQTMGIVRTSGNDSVPFAIADFNGDGKADIVMQGSTGYYELWLMNADSRLGHATLLGGGTGWTVGFATDLDGDGKADLVWTHPDGSVGGWLMDGLTVRSARQWTGSGSCWSPVAVGDFDADRKSEILWRCSNGDYGAWKMNGLDIAAARGYGLAGSGWEAYP